MMYEMRAVAAAAVLVVVTVAVILGLMLVIMIIEVLTAKFKLSWGKDSVCLLDRRLGGPQSRSGCSG
jgi:hypothetical protein